MQSRPDQGGLLTLLTQLVHARVALEVGTFTGYGAICIARGLAEDGRLTCLEVDEHWGASRAPTSTPRASAIASRSRSGRPPSRWRSCPTSRTSTSSTSTPTSSATPATTTRSSRGCVPAAARARQHAAQRPRVDPHDDQASMMAALNARIAADERVDSVLLGFADGMTLVRSGAGPELAPCGDGLGSFASADRQRRPDRQLAREAEDVRVAKPDAAV